jgi:hypothetical protein
LGVLSVRFVEQAIWTAGMGGRRSQERAVLIGGSILLYAWSLPAVVYGHVDDVLALTFTAYVLGAAASGRWVVASIAMALAIDSKPWAALALPLVAAQAGSRTRSVALAVGGALLLWVPFVIAHHGSLQVSEVQLPVTPGSGLHYFGVSPGASPLWARAAQVLIALSLGAAAVLRGRWYLVPLAAFAVRVNLDPQDWDYYLAGPIFGLFIWDVASSRLPGARVALGCFGLLILPQDLRMLQVGLGAIGPMVDLLRLALVAAPVAVLAADFCIALSARRAAPSRLKNP